MLKLAGKNVVIIGASRGVGRAIVGAMTKNGAHVLAVARRLESLVDLADEIPGAQTLAMDASADDAPRRVFAALRPDVVIVCGGAKPHGRPIQELSWQEFAVNWDSDVKMSFLFCREVLRAPLTPGSMVILISSGAAFAAGSPMSGGYAGAKRTQMFIANYAQKESDRLNLGVRFLALAPARIMPETELGRSAVECYAGYLGVSPSEFIQGMVARQTPEDVANAITELASNGAAYRGSVFTVSGEGIALAV
jgi:NAD(P)-dependent dehydrogenase (short-subunit alcohol dehydrogenase family)